jgi:GAF domain-containing protein
MDVENHNSHEGMDQKTEMIVVPDRERKRELYERSLEEIKEGVKDVDSLVSRMATVVSVLRSNLEYYFWCGFYFTEEGEMVVGPYQGSTACANITYEGVCGAAARKKESVVVPNVHEFPGHIACDERSNSEIVVPLIGENGMVIAVLDVDSTELNAFDEVDRECLEEMIMPVLLDVE